MPRSVLSSLFKGKKDKSKAGSSFNATMDGRSRPFFPKGIEVLYDPPSGEIIADVVFVHGLTGNRTLTWTARGSAGPWPRTLLPNKLSTTPVRVLAFGYDAGVVKVADMVSNSRVGNHAKDLLATLAMFREENYTNHRPIIFVVHSLGGLVCEDALLASRNSSETYHQAILNWTYGIIFMGTPHSGSGLARHAEGTAKILGLVKQTNDEILRVLRTDSEVLARIKDDFHMVPQVRERRLSIICFYEELSMPAVGEVVRKESAILPGYTYRGIHANHSDMTKFASADDPGFIAVSGELTLWLRKIKGQDVPQNPNTQAASTSPHTQTHLSTPQQPLEVQPPEIQSPLVQPSAVESPSVQTPSIQLLTEQSQAVQPPPIQPPTEQSQAVRPQATHVATSPAAVQSIPSPVPIHTTPPQASPPPMSTSVPPTPGVYHHGNNATGATVMYGSQVFSGTVNFGNALPHS